jgi:hypothetical protein
VFHPDAIDDHGAFSGPDGDPMPIREYVPWVMSLLLEGAIATTHQISNITIELAGDEAHVETYVLASHVHRNADGSRRLDTLSGRYVDRFERRAGLWKIAHRQLVVDWDKTEQLTEAYAEGTFLPGRRSTQDVSYRLGPGASAS